MGTVKWPVMASIPREDGGVAKARFGAEFKLITQEQLDAIYSSGGNDEDLVRRVLIGWSRVADADGNALAFSAEARETLIRIPYLLSAIAAAYRYCVSGCGGAAAVLAGTDISKTDRAALLAAWSAVQNGGMRPQLAVLQGFLLERKWDWPWFDDCLNRFRVLDIYPDHWDLFAPPEEGEEEDWSEPSEQEIKLERLELLALSMSAADYMSERLQQVMSLISMRLDHELRIDPDGEAAAQMMREPSPFCPLPTLPPFYPGDHSGIGMKSGEE